jgi:methylmalonyl-CoA/ethylmalonyl-CoA epimerase
MTAAPLPSDAFSDVPADGVLAVDHVGIATGDLEATVGFYRRTFGMREVHRETNVEQQVVEVMLSPAGSASVTDPATRPAQLQVLAPLSPGSPIAAFLDRSGPGLQQLAFRVADVDAYATRIRQQGLRVLYPQARSGTGSSKINFIHPKDAGGVLIELVEPPGLRAGKSARSGNVGA